MSPIRESQKARYPADWSTAVVPRIRARSGGRCECCGDCGRDHDEESLWVGADLTLIVDDGARPVPLAPYVEARCEAINRAPHPVTGSRVVLTVAHLNHQPEDCRDENLLDMCQRCHLAYDAEHHAETRAAGITASLTKAMEPLFDLPEGTSPQ